MASTTKKIAEGVFYASAGSMIMKILSGVGYFLIIRRLSVHDYGVFVLLASILSIAPFFVYFGFSRIFVSSIAKYRGEKNNGKIKGLAKEYYRTAAVIALIVYSLLLIFKGYVSEYYDNIYLLRYIGPLILFSFSQILLNGSLLLLESFEKFKLSSIVKSSEALAKSTLVILFYYSLSVDYLFYVYSASKIIAVLVSMWGIFHIVKEMRKNSVASEKGVLIGILKKHGKWELIRIITKQVITPFRYFVIKMFVNIEGVAVYDFSLKIYSLLVGTLRIKSIIFPVISRVIDNTFLVKKIITKSKKYSFYYYVSLCSLTFFILPAALNIFAPQYNDSILLIYFVLLHVFVDVYTIGRTPVMYGLKQQKFLLKTYPLSFTLEIILNIVLTKYFGVIGSIASWHLKVIIMNRIVSVYLKNKFNITLWSFKDFVSFDDYDRMIVKLIYKRIKRYLKIFKVGDAK